VEYFDVSSVVKTMAGQHKALKVLLAIKTIKAVKGGAERVFVELVNALAEQGHKVTVVTFDAVEGKPQYPLNLAVDTRYLGLGDVGEATSVVTFCQRLPAIRRTVVECKPDVVVGFTHAMYVPLSLALIGYHCPLIASEHSVPAYYKKRRFEYLLLALSSFFVSKMTVLSESVADLYPSALRRKIVIIPNAVAETKRYACPADESLNPKIIMNAGRLVESKGQVDLIEAFSLLASEYPDWNLRIVGEGELRADLEQLVKIKGLEGRVFLPGNSDEIEPDYLVANVFAMSSVYEGFGLVVLEAMAYGLPVIAYDSCSGVNELIEPGINGLLVEGENRVESMSAGLKKLIDNPGVRSSYGLAGIELARRYSPERVYLHWNKLLCDVVEKGAGQ
jgi:glycosyltransferase involved in cell wall biosynthesis